MNKVVNDPAIEIKRISGNDRPAGVPSRLDTDLYHAMESTAHKMFPQAITLPDMLTGATDSAQLRAKGVQAYGLGSVSTDQDRSRVHGNDERLSIEGLGKFVQFLYTAATDVAASRRAR